MKAPLCISCSLCFICRPPAVSNRGWDSSQRMLAVIVISALYSRGLRCVTGWNDGATDLSQWKSRYVIPDGLLLPSSRARCTTHHPSISFPFLLLLVLCGHGLAYFSLPTDIGLTHSYFIYRASQDAVVSVCACVPVLVYCRTSRLPLFLFFSPSFYRIFE